VDKTFKTLGDLKKLIQDVVHRGFISDSCADSLVPKGAIIPRLYGLPKVHKRDTPLRPILSMVGSPYHRLAKFLAQMLKPVEQFYCQHTITDSFDLVDGLCGRQFSGDADLCLGSLDVVSLFTSIPVDKCIAVIADAVDSQTVNIDIDGLSISRLLSFCVKNVQFLFDGKLYSQVDGVAMGSPLAPILANIFVGYIETRTPSIQSDALFFGRYVDDILVIAHSARNIEKLKDSLNTVDPDIQFTMEIEDNRSLPFLDVRIHRTTEGLRFSWYHKETWKGSLLHYASFVPNSWKFGLLKGFKYRILHLCSPEFLQRAVDELVDVFGRNGYPTTVIQSCFLDYLPALKSPKNITTVPGKPVVVYLPFVGDTNSHQLANRLNRYVRSAFPAARVLVRWYPRKACFNSLKDQLQPFSMPNVVYLFSCYCGTEDYVGRTQLPLGERVRQHLPKWLLQGRKQRPRSQKGLQSAIARHALDCTAVDDDLTSRFKVIQKAKNALDLKILEALEIKDRRPSLCIQKEYLYDLKIPWF